MNPFLPKVKITKVLLLPKGPETTTVKVYLKVVETTAGDLSAKIMKEYFDYFKVRIMFLNHEKIFNEITLLKSLARPTIQKDFNNSKILLAVKKATGQTSTSGAMYLLEQYSFSNSWNNIFKDVDLKTNEGLHTKDGIVYLNHSIDIPKASSFLGAVAFVEMVPYGSSGISAGQNISTKLAESLGGAPSAEVILDEGTPTTKVQDFRPISRSSNLNTSPFKSGVPKDDFTKLFGITKSGSKDYPYARMKVQRNNIFSDLLSSHDANGAVRFCFFMDFENLLKKYGNGMFIGVLPAINSFKIKRRQILNRGSKTSLGKSEIVETIGQPQIILTARTSPQSFMVKKEKGFKLQSSTNYDKTGLIGGVSEKLVSSKTIRMFEVFDNEISSHSAATYQYGVEIKLEDPLLEFLGALREKINTRLLFLKRHYVYGAATSGFDLTTGKYKPEAKQKLTNAWTYMTEPVTTGDQWKIADPKSLVAYFSGSGFLPGNWFSGLGLASDILTSIRKLLHPSEASPESIDLVVSAISNALHRLDMMLDSFSNSKIHKKGSSTGNSVSNTTGTKGGSSIKTIELEHWFPALVEKASSISGYEFFTPSLKPTTGLIRINLEAFKERVVRENEKFFKSGKSSTVGPGGSSGGLGQGGQQGPIGNTAQSAHGTIPQFFSADRVCINSEKIKIETPTSTIAEKIMMDVLKLKQNITEKSSQLDPELKTKVALSLLFGKQNCTFFDEKEGLGHALSITPDKPEHIYGSYFGPDEAVHDAITATDLTNPKIIQTTPAGLLSNLIVGEAVPAYRLKDYKALSEQLLGDSSALDKQMNGKNVNALGNFIINSFEAFTTSPEFLSLYWLLFENIVTLQELNIDSKTNVSQISPQCNTGWKDLNVSNLLSQQGTSVICRVKPITDKERVSLKLREQTKLPIFNKYFVLET